MGQANFENSSERGPLNKGASPEVPRFAVDKSVEFSYDELANAIDNFSTSYKIGRGGFASVYYGELRGEKDGIKKMDMQSTKKFLAELKVLAHVHHLNLVNSLIILVYYLFLLDYITSLAPAQFRLFIILQSF